MLNLNLIKSAARGGALASCAVSVVVNGDKYSKGELDAAAAARKTATDTAAGAGKGAATGALAIGLTRLLPRFLRGGAGTIAIAATTVEVGIDAVRLARGSIDGKQFARRSANNAVKSGAVWAMAKVGAAVGAPLGPVGAGIGGLAGGLVGWVVAGKLTGTI